MELLAPIGLWSALIIGLIIAVYFLKVRRPDLPMSSLFLWPSSKLDRQANAPWQRLQKSLLLLCQILVAVSLVAAISHPAIIGPAQLGQTTVVLIDATPSMLATDVAPNRFEWALEYTRALAGNLPPGASMAVVLVGSSPRLLTPITSDAGEVNRALGGASIDYAPAQFGAAVSLANAILVAQSNGSILYLGDGHARVGSVVAKTGAAFKYIQVGNSDVNAGIDTLARTADGNVFARVNNYARTAFTGEIAFYVDGVLADVLPVAIDGNSSTQVNWTRFNGSGEVLNAKLRPGDAFPLDQQAWLLLQPPPPHRVLLVTPDGGFLIKALKLSKLVDLSVITPDKYTNQLADLYIFDRFAPSLEVSAPAIYISPPSGTGPLPLGAELPAGSVFPPDAKSPILTDVDLRDVHIGLSRAVANNQDWKEVFASNSGSALLIHPQTPRAAEFTFDLHQSDLPLRAGFPILVDNLLNYLLPSNFENQSYLPGGEVTLIAQPKAKKITITDPLGNIHAFYPPLSSITYSATIALGVYSVEQTLAEGTIRNSKFIVSFRDPSISRIAPGVAPLTIPDQESYPVPHFVHSLVELWPYLLVAALLLLLVEWFVYLRGIS